MSSATRTALSKLRRQYAKTFNVHLEEVEVSELEDENGEVWTPKHPELPRWTLKSDKVVKTKTSERG